MSVPINHVSARIHLFLKDGKGALLHQEIYDFASVADLPIVPEIGSIWNVVIDGNSYGTTVTERFVTSFVGGNSFQTNLHVEATA